MFGNFLQGKTAVITGGGGTIGLALARALLSPHGTAAVATAKATTTTTTATTFPCGGVASLILIGRSMEKLEQAQANLMASSQSHSSNNSKQPTVSIFSCDVSNEASVLDLFQTLDQHYPKGIDLWINNAGTTTHGATIDLSGAEFERVLQVNVVGAFLCAREALKRMKARGEGGRIINVGSLASYRSRPHSVAYTTSKFALRGLTESLALDARPYQVALGMIHPGNVVSDLLTSEERHQRQQAEGFLEADQVAQCVLTMASLPYTANILELTVLPVQQPFVGRG